MKANVDAKAQGDGSDRAHVGVSGNEARQRLAPKTPCSLDQDTEKECQRLAVEITACFFQKRVSKARNNARNWVGT